MEVKAKGSARPWAPGWGNDLSSLALKGQGRERVVTSPGKGNLVQRMDK